LRNHKKEKNQVFLKEIKSSKYELCIRLSLRDNYLCQGWEINMLKRRVVLISGCSSGFGMLTTVEMVRRGFVVIATMRDLEKRDRLEEALSQQMMKKSPISNFVLNVGKDNLQFEKNTFLDTPHPLCKLFKLDVTNPDLIQSCVQAVIERFGSIDVLVNNAGSGLGGFAEDISLEEFRTQFEINFWGLVALTKAVIPYMRIHRQGHIINISSIAGMIGTPGLSSYCASKFAVEGFSESLRYELLRYNIWVSLVEPGTYRTNIHNDPTQLVTSIKNPESAYYEWGKKLLSKTLEQVKHSKANPEEVAKLIANIAESKKAKLRYVIGDEAIYILVKKLIPAFLFEKLICNYYD
jgi:NAD(P)-dependent dehydrogenase (short-subunit alcohol dehydrogenase family)